MLRLINMRAHRNNTTYPRGIRFRWSRTRRVHDAVLGTPKKIRTPTKTVQHPAAHHTRAIRMRIDVYFNRRVHADDSQTPRRRMISGELLTCCDRRISFGA